MKLQLAAIALALGAQSLAAASAETLTPTSVVDAFAAALQQGDAVQVEDLMTSDALVAEEGGAERSFAEYKAAHLPADIEFSRAVARKVVDRRVWTTGRMASVVTEAEMTGTFRGRAIASRSMETMVLIKTKGAWRIAHIHWSSAPMDSRTSN
jgi:ketosteroid isomerase-like protein